MYVLLKICLCCFLQFFVNIETVKAQTSKEIDSFLDVAYLAYRNQEFETAINYSFDVSRISEKAEYEKGQVRAYMIIADCLMFQGAYKECLKYVRKIESHKDYLVANPYDHWMLKRLAFESYDMLGLKSLTRIEYKNAMNIIMLEKDKQKRSLGLNYMYSNAGGLFFDDVDSIYDYLLKALLLMQDEEFKAHQKQHYHANLGGLYIKMGDFFNIKKYNADSALYYYDLAAHTLNSHGISFYKAGLYSGYSLLFEKLENYELSIEMRLKSLDILISIHVMDAVLKDYNKLVELYGKINDVNKENKYLSLARSLKDSVGVEKSQGTEEAIINLINKKENEVQQLKTKHNYLTAGIIIGVFVILLISYYYFRKYKQNKQRLLLEKDNTIREKESVLEKKNLFLKNSMEIITEKLEKEERLNELLKAQEQKTYELKQKINESFAEITQLAKENDPQFLSRFQEVYPEFVSKLLMKNPDLKNTELNLCAYIYMDFSSKEIADYTFKSLKTIQNRKNILRKRLDIASSIDLNVWMMNV